MNFKVENSNYACTVVEIKHLINFENCDNVQGAIVSGYQVVVSKESKVGDIGLFFPVECQISQEYLKQNNLFSNAELNLDKTKKGYFSDNGRLKCVKFRGNKSEGLFMPLDSLNFIVNTSELKVGDEFQTINDFELCKKYVVFTQQTQIQGKSKKQKKVEKVSRIVENQFRLHIDTEQLKKNMHKIHPEDLISITSKYHGSSFVSSNVLVKRKLSMKDKIAKLFGVSVKDTEYGNIYSSRNVIKNAYEEKEQQGYYSKDIWKSVNDKIKDLIPKGFSIYGEIVGYVDGKSYIQKGYDYGCVEGTHKLYVYRITQTNEDGKVFELTRPEIDEFCKCVGLKTTPLYFYGYAKDMYPDIPIDEQWQDTFLTRLQADGAIGMADVMCKYNKMKVPSEGVVLRKERMFKPEPFKLKNYAFLTRESKELDSGVEDIESAN